MPDEKQISLYAQTKAAFKEIISNHWVTDQEDLEDGSIAINVIGEFSAGKTEVINRILKTTIPPNLVPISSQEVQTRLRLEITFGEKPELLVVKRKSDRDPHCEPLKKLEKFPKRSELADYDPKQHRLRLYIKDEKLILPFGDGFLEGTSPRRLFLIDNPGWNNEEDDSTGISDGYFEGRQNLALVYVCKLDRVDGKDNWETLTRMLNELQDYDMPADFMPIIYIITHCEDNDFEAIKKREREKLDQLYADNYLSQEEYPLEIICVEFKDFDDIQGENFKTKFWQSVLRASPNNDRKPINQWPIEWDIAQTLSEDLKALNYAVEIMDKVVEKIYKHSKDNYFLNLNMAVLKYFDPREICERTMREWMESYSVSKYMIDEIKENIDGFRYIDKNCPWYEWYTTCWYPRILNKIKAIHKFFLEVFKAIYDLNSDVEDLDQWMWKHIYQSYLQASKPLPPSIWALQDELDYFVPSIIHMVENQSTLMSLLLIEARYADAFDAEFSIFE